MPIAITLAGLGPGGREALPLGVWEALRGADPRVYLRTARHPVVEWLAAEGVAYHSFDSFYEEEADFAAVYRRIAGDVLDAAADGPLVYATPGHPLVAEEASRLIIDGARERGLEIRLLAAPSFLDALFATLRLDPADGLNILDALAPDRMRPLVKAPNVLIQVHSRMVAGEAKIRLMDYYPDDHPVTVVRAAGVEGEERVASVPLYELDRLSWIDHLTSVYLPPVPAGTCYAMDDLVAIMAALRAENGCPWDREQTHESLRRYLIEETYEVVEAVEQGDMHSLCEELGDLLLQIVFHARIARENGEFDIGDVISAICRKMIHRHPHVFGEAKVKDAAEVLANWERIKQGEKQGRVSCLAGVPRNLPALLRADQVQAKVARIGFDWPDYRGALAKVEEELAEVREALAGDDRGRLAEELGDLLFAAVNLARLRGLDAEEALGRTVDKFIRRFNHIEERIRQSGRRLGDVDLEEMDRWWDEAKNLEKSAENFS
ncbi:MAG: nucleoside triphosphate pyrophosphohydrolase [Bacillota bacterium]|nr:nucleoside triphosphate pyrophosphohydrolase [Bacillota bacterium]